MAFGGGHPGGMLKTCTARAWPGFATPPKHAALDEDDLGSALVAARKTQPRIKDKAPRFLQDRTNCTAAAAAGVPMKKGCAERSP